ncbi:MAG: HAMP domain-containing protein [Solirubrobacterales bacterium]|nr:HAMP domain-containing protein [Solirubrobacterales bacterium]
MRARLTAVYALVFVLAMAAVLLVSYLLMRGHLQRTLPDADADSVLHQLARQYGLALLGALLLAVALGWLAAGRLLAPIRAITRTARRVSDERLEERIALQGPRDELRELADTFDAMLDRLQGALDGQRRFVANASHELRGPLTVIRTEAEVTLADPDASPAELREMGEAVLEATERTENLLDGLLVLARSQRALLRQDPVDLAVAARRAVSEAADAASAAHVRVRLATCPAPVRGDEALLVRLVGNLVDNGIRYNASGGDVDVRTEARDGHVCVRVENTGAVVPADKVELLTQPFERLGRRADGRGAGLGLSIVRAVAEAHGGALRLRARDGGGLVAEVELPARGPVA